MNNVRLVSSAAVNVAAVSDQYEKIQLTLRLTDHNDNMASGSSTSTNYGFIIAGYCPCHVENVLENSVAERAGLRKGDLIIKVNDTNCCRARIKTLLTLIKCNKTLKLNVVRRLPGSFYATGITTTTAENIKRQHIKYDTSRILARKTLSKQRKPESIKNKTKATGQFFGKLFSKRNSWLSCATRPLAGILLNNGCVQATTATKNANDNSTGIETEKCGGDLSMFYTANGSSGVAATQHVNTIPHLIESNSQYESCMREFSSLQHSKQRPIKSTVSTADTGYETLSRFDSAATTTKHSTAQEDEDLSIETVTNTLNSYSHYDLTVAETPQIRKQKKPLVASKSTATLPDPDEPRTRLIGELIELEANFVTFMSTAVATFSRPLRGFFMRQQDYFTLFQNIEKITVISENFLHSMDKWSAYDLYTKLGHLYAQKLALFREALTIYAQGYTRARELYVELRAYSRQFRLFLAEVQCAELTLSAFLAAPLVHMRRTLALFKRIRACTPESPRRPSEAPHIDSVVLELRQILAHAETEEATVFMNDHGSVISAIDEEVAVSRRDFDQTSCCSSGQSAEDDESDDNGEEVTNCDFSSFFNSIVN